MRLIRSFGLIGAGAFAAGIFYSKAGYDRGIDNRLIFAASLAIAIAGLVDLVAIALRSRHQQLWLK
jgi:hypothetical protein